MKKLLSILLLSLGFAATAQNEGTLRLYLSPPAEAVTIDGNVMDFGNSSTLKPGKYFLQAWCPNKALLDTIIEIKEGEILSFFYRFENSQAYNDYLYESQSYSKELNKHFTLPMASTVLVAGALVFTYFKGKELQEDAENKYELYKYAGFDLDKRKSEFEKAQKKYKGYYYAQFVEYGALVVSSYFLYKGIQWLKKNQKPQLAKDQNPFTLDRIGFMPNKFGGYGLGVAIKLN